MSERERKREGAREGSERETDTARLLVSPESRGRLHHKSDLALGGLGHMSAVENTEKVPLAGLVRVWVRVGVGAH